MSRTAKVFFGVSLIVAIGSIGGVHLSQYQERQTMFAGVLRDDARLASKRAARQAEFDEQIRKRAYLETLQSSSSSIPNANNSGSFSTTEDRKRIEVMSKEEAGKIDWGCKDCERE